jgi:hypothetical protein
MHSLSYAVRIEQQNVQDQVRLQVLKGVTSNDVQIISRAAGKSAAKEMVAEAKRQAELDAKKAAKKWDGTFKR